MKKRSKILAIIMVLAFALTGVGYAWWTDTLYINGTVETGTLDVDFIAEEGCYPFMQDYPDIEYKDRPWFPLDNGLVETDITADGDDKYIVTITGLYPGAKVRLDVKQQNVGSVPAKFANAELKFTKGAKYAEYLKGAAHYRTNTYLSGNILGACEDWRDNVWVWDDFDKLDDRMNEVLGNKLILAPGDWLTFSTSDEGPGCIWIMLDEEAPNSVQDRTIEFVLTMNWKQFNDNSSNA